MADDHSQRAYRSNEYARQPSKAGQGNDPLAELARLIGQTDPFAEFGGKSRQTADVVPHQQASYPQHQEWAPQPYVTPGFDQNADYSNHPPPDAGRSNYDQYAAGYDDDARYQNDAFYEGEQAHDDVSPPHRRLSIMALAAVASLAVLGSAGALGYRVLYGSSGSSPPPVIKAETTPTKIVPPTKSDPQSNKLIYDRVGDRGKDEKIVSREEQPLDIAKTPQSAFPNAVGPGSPAASTAGSAPVMSMEQPKKIHTIAIRPDQQTNAPEAAPPAATRAASAPASAAPRANAPQRLASAPPVATADAEDNAPVTRSTPQRPAAALARNAPLSLSPNAPPPAATAPVRTATGPRATAPAASASGQYAVQISSQRSEAEAEAAFRALQGKFPSQLGNRQPVIRRADLGSKGVYYRALVGPFAEGSDAVALCQSLKAAGGSCLIQKN